MPHKFSPSETTEVSTAISKAVARNVRKFPILRTSADDIAQDAWVKVLSGYDATTGKGPGAYAYTVATTISIDYARNRGAKLRARDGVASLDAPVSADDENTTSLVDTLASTVSDPATIMHSNVRAAAVQAALATLSDSGRAAIEAWQAGETMTGSQRVAKLRAVAQLEEEISSAL